MRIDNTLTGYVWKTVSDWWRYDKDMVILIGGAIIIVAVTFYLVQISIAEQESLMQQCMEDGHKEYECVSMLRRGSSSVIAVPVR